MCSSIPYHLIEEMTVVGERWRREGGTNLSNFSSCMVRVREREREREFWGGYTIRSLIEFCCMFHWLLLLQLHANSITVATSSPINTCGILLSSA